MHFWEDRLDLLDVHSLVHASQAAQCDLLLGMGPLVQLFEARTEYISEPTLMKTPMSGSNSLRSFNSLQWQVVKPDKL